MLFSRVISDRLGTSRRDDAALPHELIPVPTNAEPVQSSDDGHDGNSTPNGGI